MSLSIETLNVLLLFFPGLLASAVLKVVLKRPDVDATQRLIEATLFTIVITVTGERHRRPRPNGRREQPWQTTTRDEEKTPEDGEGRAPKERSSRPLRPGYRGPTTLRRPPPPPRPPAPPWRDEKVAVNDR